MLMLSYTLLKREQILEEVKKAQKKNPTTIFKPLWVWSREEEELIKSRIIGFSLNLCSGSSWHVGDVTLDLYVEADIQADNFHLPFRDLCFDTVIWDPPWAWANPKSWRNKTMKRWKDVMALVREVSRITRKRLIVRQGIYLFDFQPEFELTEAWLVKRINFVPNILTIWDRFISKLKEAEKK